MAAIYSQRAVGYLRSLTVEVVAAADGSVDLIALPDVEGALLALQTTPGTPAPSDGYDVQLVNLLALDVLMGVGMHRSSTATQRAIVRFPGEEIHPIVDEADAAHLQIDGNHVPFAVVTVTIVYGLAVSEP